MRCLLSILCFYCCLLHGVDYEVVYDKLQIPWDIAWLPDGSVLITERPGNLALFSQGKKKDLPIKTTYHSGEGGLMGMTLHPDFPRNHWIYLYNTVEKQGRTYNQVERYALKNGTLQEKTLIISDIPGASYHDGGRIAFGPDGYLYVTTGDAGYPRLAQDLDSLAGKILRITENGSIPTDNPYGTAIYSYGHRNAQGLTWDNKGRLWSTEHGPSGLIGGRDELNLIEKGANYGWPDSTGAETKDGTKAPLIQSGYSSTWAPASALYWDGSIFFGGLRGQALYEVPHNQQPLPLKEHFKGTFGRIRTVVQGPDGYFYLMTSNRDGRGDPHADDDRVIKIDPKQFR